jgi:ATP-dependent DNA helicase RecQ
MQKGQEANLKEKLKEIFGHSQFRGNQEEIIRNLMRGNHTFVIMPTGAGKSLCYQLPAVIMDGTAIVISPLIALMKNQTDQLVAFGIDARFLNSTLSKTEMTKVKKDVLSGKVKMLYVAPESLTKEENLEFLKKANISFVAIDEAHCISEWGHDFRPEYRKIRGIVDSLGKNLPIIALTATATPKVQQDIQKNLQMEDANVFTSSFHRPNLFYEVKPKRDPKKQLIRFIKQKKGQSGIVYCLSRKTVEEIAELLCVNDIKALPYHAGLEADVRMKNQDAFLNEDVDVIVATIAFGMGIDKPDVRFVIHYDAPKSLEGYYQETGRAGRDGLEGHCLMLYDREDIYKLEKFNKDKSVTERDNAKHLLQEIAEYAECSVCRVKQLLHYFGEEFKMNNCGQCDNCSHPHKKYEAEEQVLLALKAVKQTGERFGAKHIADVLMGIPNDYVKSYKHDKLEVYGKGLDYPDTNWLSLLRHILIFDYLEKDIENYGVLKITPKGEKFLKNPYSITLTRDYDFSNTAEDEEAEQETTTPASGKAYDEVLYDLLKNLRKRIAKEKNLPPYVIFQDPSLEEMATTYPTTKEELAQVNGVGMGKVQKFGKPFLDAIVKYVEENEIETASDVVVKSTVNKSKVKIFIIQQIDRKVDLEEIAEAKDLTFEELMDEIEHICYSGTKLNLDYYINQVIEKERQQQLYDYFMNSETDDLQVAIQELADEDFTEEEIRLMRIKFISEVAN